MNQEKFKCPFRDSADKQCCTLRPSMGDTGFLPCVENVDQCPVYKYISSLQTMLTAKTTVLDTALNKLKKYEEKFGKME